MNYYVPDFEMEDEQPFISTSSSTVTHPHKAEDEILELLWQDGQVVAQPRKFQSSTALAPQHNQQQQQQEEQQLYMAEDEMATWLHYPIEDLYSDLISDNPSSSLPPVSTVRQSTVIRPPIPPPQQVEAPIQQPQIKVAAPLQQPQLKVAVSLQQQSQSKVVAPPRQPPSKVAVAVAQEKPPVTVVAPLRNFQMFSRMRGKGPEVRAEKAVVDSNTTPVVAAMRSVGEVSSSVEGCRLLETGGGSGEMTVSSSSGTSGGGGGPTNNTCTTGDVLTVGVSQEGRKRKQRGEIDETATTPTTTTDQDVELDAADDEKKHPQGLHSMKRTRAAEVHNLSERKRRDRINEKMKALQELIPRCNKSDKASMLDEVIEYLKSLQMQVQMMSMGCGMVPMMYPGMQQQFMPPTMGMGMGMDTGMNRPMMPFPSNMPASNLPTTSAVVGAGPHIAPNFGIQPVPMPSVPAAANFPVNQGDSVRSSFPVQTPPGLPQQPSMGDQYQQFMALQQMQMQMQMHMQMQMQAAQNQSISRPGSSKPSTSKSEGPSGPSTSKSEGPPGPSTSKSEAEDDE